MGGRGKGPGPVEMQRKTEAGPGDSGAGGTSLLKTRPQCPGPVPASDPGVCTTRPGRRDPPSHPGSSGGGCRKSHTKPRPPFTHGPLGGRRFLLLFRPRLHTLIGLDIQTTPTGLRVRNSGEAPPPAHPLAFDASDPPIETAARGLAERRQRPPGEAAAGCLTLSEAFGSAPVALFPRTWLLLHSAARRVSQSSFHPIIGLELHRSLARGHSP